MKAKLDHIAVVVSSIDKALDWFGKYLGFDNILVKAPIKASGQSGTRCLVANENYDVLEFCEYDEKSKTHTGIIQHLGFTVDSAKEFFDKLNNDGELDSEVKIKDMGPANILFFKGYEGIEIELIEKKGN